MKSFEMKKGGNGIEKKKTLKVGLAVLGATIALSACSNPKVTSAQTRSNSIQECSTDPGQPNSSVGIKASGDYAKVLAEAKKEADSVYVKTMANGGKITFNSNLGTSVEANKSQLTINFNNASTDMMAGFSADIGVDGGRPAIGLGFLACNVGSEIYQTKLAVVLEEFNAATVNFPS